jgi:hypothetical protein
MLKLIFKTNSKVYLSSLLIFHLTSFSGVLFIKNIKGKPCKFHKFTSTLKRVLFTTVLTNGVLSTNRKFVSYGLSSPRQARGCRVSHARSMAYRIVLGRCRAFQRHAEIYPIGEKRLFCHFPCRRRILKRKKTIKKQK